MVIERTTETYVILFKAIMRLSNACGCTHGNTKPNNADTTNCVGERRLESKSKSANRLRIYVNPTSVAVRFGYAIPHALELATLASSSGEGYGCREASDGNEYRITFNSVTAVQVYAMQVEHAIQNLDDETAETTQAESVTA